MSFHGKRVGSHGNFEKVEFAIAEEKNELSSFKYSLFCLYVKLFGRCRVFLLPYTSFRLFYFYSYYPFYRLFSVSSRFTPLHAVARGCTPLHAAARLCTPRHASRRWNPWPTPLHPTGHRHFIVSKLRRCPRQRIVSGECPLFLFRPR